MAQIATAPGRLFRHHMAIEKFSREELGERIAEVVSPSQPISSVEFLKGRERELQDIERAMYAKGRSIFIYGDRGVGKSSLAATAAYLHQTADAKPVFVGGAKGETFVSIIANIANQALGRSRVHTSKVTRGVALEWRGLKWSWGQEISARDVTAQLAGVGDAVDLLSEVAAVHSDSPVVVIDEFDAIDSPEERGKFAMLLKHLGDRGVPLKIIFTGIGTSVTELLGAHASASRQLAQIEVTRLGWEARREVVIHAAQKLGLDVDENVAWRMAIVSDGYPAYLHLITEAMLWQAADDNEACDELTFEHYHLGLRKAISMVTLQLQEPYKAAVLYRPEEMEDIVWATADGDDLWRDTRDMYEAYKMIAARRERLEVMDRGNFTKALGRLKTKSYGELLQGVTNRPGWYTYTEKMVRGYVRMQAEAHGVELNGERPAQRQRMHVSSSARSGYRGSQIPRGARLDFGQQRERAEEEDA